MAFVYGSMGVYRRIVGLVAARKMRKACIISVVRFPTVFLKSIVSFQNKLFIQLFFHHSYFRIIFYSVVDIAALALFPKIIFIRLLLCLIYFRLTFCLKFG